MKCMVNAFNNKIMIIFLISVLLTYSNSSMNFLGEEDQQKNQLLPTESNIHLVSQFTNPSIGISEGTKFVHQIIAKQKIVKENFLRLNKAKPISNKVAFSLDFE